MNINGQAAIVTGGASGLGAETARELARRGAKVTVADVNIELAKKVAAEIGGIVAHCDITSEESAVAAIKLANDAHGKCRILVNCAGVGGAKRIVGKDGSAMPLADFARTININLIGTFNMLRLIAAEMVSNDALADDERGVIINTSSIAAYDGQIGLAAYAASKGGLVSMTLPLARDLAQFGVRVMTIAPGLFLTPLMDTVPPDAKAALAASVPFPKRLGQPIEFAQLAATIVENVMLNGEVIRLDGAIRMAPR